MKVLVVGTIVALIEAIDIVDAVVAALGKAPFKPLRAYACEGS